jgi:hypothetical protein
MAIIQISKLQQRTGNLVDLPQLDEGEFGWANDDKRLFIGKTTPNENVEVLTSYSQISFSQVDGSDGGNLNISNAQTGQVLTYDSVLDVWTNAGGNASQPGNTSLYSDTNIHLGNVSNVKIGGGAIGYILETDGTGNLSWTPKGTLYTEIIALSNATPIVMTVNANTPYTNDTLVTITSADGANANSIVNGQSFYIQLAVDYATSGNVSLYTGTGGSGPVDGTDLGASTPNVAIATSVIGGAGGGGGASGGSNTTVQFNDSGISNGVAAFTFNKLTTTLAITGNANVANINATSTVVSPVLISNIATGTAPLTVTSTTRVSNLNVAYANVSDYGVTTTQTTGTFYPTFVNANTTGNLALGSNANLSFNAANGRLSATLLGGTLTTAAQPNITSVGVLTSLSVSGNATVGNLLGVFANGTSNVSIPTADGNVNISVGGVANVLLVTTNGANVSNLNASGNIVAANLMGPHANGTSSVNMPAAGGNINMSVNGNANVAVITGTGANIAGTFSASGNANVGNLGTSGKVIASSLESNVATGTAPLTVASTTRVNNLNVAYANVSDFNLMSALTTGTYYPTFVSGTAAANYALGSNTAFSANIANGYFSANGITTTNITTGANTTAGTLTGNWTLSTGSRMQATYADLAEYYEADQVYEPGTVLEFGGEKEVTIAEDGTTRVAGVVSTNPAYAMNAKCPGIAVAIALQGRVPCKVRGKVRKGDIMVSAGNGFARPWNNAQIGMVIGKAIENFEGIEGTIEIAVGRL